MNRNVKANRVSEDWTVIFLQSVLKQFQVYNKWSLADRFQRGSLAFVSLFLNNVSVRCTFRLSVF